MTEKGGDHTRAAGPDTRMTRMSVISGFHQDAAGDWVADLACGHTQHVRHRPPWQSRPWVTTDAGRAAKIGAPIDCPACAREASSAP